MTKSKLNQLLSECKFITFPERPERIMLGFNIKKSKILNPEEKDKAYKKLKNNIKAPNEFRTCSVSLKTRELNKNKIVERFKSKMMKALQ